MTREETKELFKKIMVAYPTFKPVDLSEAVTMWSKALEKCVYEDVLKRFDKYIGENKFPPTIADLNVQRVGDNWNIEKPRTKEEWEELERMVINK